MHEILSTRLKELRNELDITQVSFASQIGVTQAALSAYEKGDRIPSIDVLVNISKKYNISIDWLCGLSSKILIDKEITTYADMFELLVKLCSIHYDVIWDNANVIEPSLLQSSKNVHFIVHDDENFTKFFTEWKKIYSLLSDHTIDEKLYTLWLNDKLSEYIKPIDKVPF